MPDTTFGDIVSLLLQDMESMVLTGLVDMDNYQLVIYGFVGAVDWTNGNTTANVATLITCGDEEQPVRQAFKHEIA